MEKIWDKVGNFIFYGIAATIIVAGVAMTLPRYYRTQYLMKEREQALQRVAEKTREIALYHERQRRFVADREFVEALGRENRRAFPNELVFVFND